ncbi:MAG: DNA-directed RNA polymerase subunit omega [bacterium]
MNEKDVDYLISKAENKFLLSNAASGRAKQITEGSLPYVSNFDPNNPVITALREIANDKIKIKVLAGPAEVAEKLMPQKEIRPKNSGLDRLAKDAKRSKEKKRK